MATLIFVALLFIALGILIKYGKAYGLIAGYNTMSKEEKARYDIIGIATLFRNVMFTMAAIILLGVLLSYLLKESIIETIALFAAILTGVPYLLIRSNSKRYQMDK
ncbi:DUF3784 domain-containing protein [Altibacter sp.]|uniref:DUF3784 domain-containing protein n=1 Tax=Altibacter sp. TaxID=2024823 RepID=UPI000C993A7A|nr:DUF3784 domain-containing protein [Altibacter sp.]MAP54905.1 hypothetical protein [Altibacter sp.]